MGEEYAWSYPDRCGLDMTDSLQNSADPSLEQLQAMMIGAGVRSLLVKVLAANDTSKNQPYFGGNLDVINILPFENVEAETASGGAKRFKAALSFSWLHADGSVAPAPHAQLILYPQYPEVRFSGFLRGVDRPPSEIMNMRQQGRLLFLGLTHNRKIVGWVSNPSDAAAREFLTIDGLERVGVFWRLPLGDGGSSLTGRSLLFRELRRVHELDWIQSKALTSRGIVECNSSQCVGYTLEAELSIARNSRAEPDFDGWEVKASQVKNYEALPNSKVLTLMTPEPTGGYYRQNGVAAFIRRFGYPDRRGRSDRRNFGGVYRAAQRHELTELTLVLSGYDSELGRVIDPEGSMSLITDSGEIAAEWSFASLMLLWNRKHSKAVFVPAEARTEPRRAYRYGRTVQLGEGTDFNKLVSAVNDGAVYYDPGIKMEGVSSGTPRTKARSQFRITLSGLARLYQNFESVEV